LAWLSIPILVVSVQLLGVRMGRAVRKNYLYYFEDTWNAASELNDPSSIAAACYHFAGLEVEVEVT
jgi:hypothetical protein